MKLELWRVLSYGNLDNYVVETEGACSKFCTSFLKRQSVYVLLLGTDALCKVVLLLSSFQLN